MTFEHIVDDFGNAVDVRRFKWQHFYWRMGFSSTTNADRVEREFVDFGFVPPGQAGMHARLEDWARWCRSRAQQGVAPGFALHKSDHWDQREYGSATQVPIDKFDAAQIAKGVAMLPDRQRQAITWYYGGGRRPLNKARELAVSIRTLRDLVGEGRQMLINRRV